MTKIERIDITYNLTFMTPFHCGTGLRLGSIDRTIVRDHNGYLYVPGSTIKGVLREHCERLTRLFEGLDNDMDALVASPHDTEKALWALGYPATMITRIFGSPTSPGHLFFDDAHQTKPAKLEYDSQEDNGEGKYKGAQIDFSTQVRIDRPTRTAVRAALYTSEFGIKDLSFEGHISGWLECIPIEGVEGDPTYSLLLLLASLQLLDRIGGNKSTGKGHCQCEVMSVKRGDTVDSEEQEKTLEEKEQWPRWFDHLDVLSFYSSYAVSQEEV